MATTSAELWAKGKLWRVFVIRDSLDCYDLRAIYGGSARLVDPAELVRLYGYRAIAFKLAEGKSLSWMQLTRKYVQLDMLRKSAEKAGFVKLVTDDDLLNPKNHLNAKGR